MMRINLLGVAPPPGARPAGPPATLGRHMAIYLVCQVVLLIVVGVFWKVWSHEVDVQQKRLDDEKREQARLARFKAENLQFEQQKRQLEQRINTIQMLQASRVGPVELMTGLSNTVNRTNDLYLLSVAPSGARTILRGQSFSVESIARFIAALKESGLYDDVQLQQYFQDDKDNRVSFKFNIDFLYKPPAAPSAAAPAATARRAGK